MLLFIIYLAMVVVITAISMLAKGSDRDLLVFNNLKLQRFVRLFFVISVIFVLFNPFPIITDYLMSETDATAVFIARVTQFGLNISAGAFAGILTWCAIKIIKWIWL